MLAASAQSRGRLKFKPGRNSRTGRYFLFADTGTERTRYEIIIAFNPPHIVVEKCGERFRYLGKAQTICEALQIAEDHYANGCA